MNKLKAFTLKKKTSAKGTTYWTAPYGNVDLLCFEDKEGQPGDIVAYYSERTDPRTAPKKYPAPGQMGQQRQRPRIIPRPQQVIARPIPQPSPAEAYFDDIPMPSSEDEFGF